MIKLDVSAYLKKLIDTLSGSITTINNTLATKASISLDNLNSTGLNQIVRQNRLSYEYASDVTSTVIASSGIGYTPSRDGYLFLFGVNSNGQSYLHIYNGNGQEIWNILKNNAGIAGGSGSLTCVPCYRGYYYRSDVYYGTTGKCIFVPFANG